MKQRDAFLKGEGDKWFRRNKKRIGEGNDPILEAIQTYKIKPKHVLEVGCSNGWRLNSLHCLTGCTISGIDPGDFRSLGIDQGAADNLGRYTDNAFDMVIYGWCLYLCDPEDYFRIAAEGDRVLRNEGHLVVYDFYASHPTKVPYQHKKGLFSYHFDFARLWENHPAYSLRARVYQENAPTVVTILKKNFKTAFRT